MSKLVPDRYFLNSDNFLLTCTKVIKVLLILRKSKPTSLFNELKKQIPNISPDEFVLAINVLFALGKIQYSKTTDELELQ